jgi:hypothetical protein
MLKKTQIWNFDHTIKITVPPSCQRLCAQCLNPMPIHHYHWQQQHEVHIVYLCQHRSTGRFKSVVAKLDRRGRLS